MRKAAWDEEKRSNQHVLTHRHADRREQLTERRTVEVVSERDIPAPIATGRRGWEREVHVLLQA